jgi:predicted nucleic-acid-binding protein
VKSLDTNVLARFFVDDPDDPEAARQRPAAVAAMSEPAFVTVTVLLELEWVLRGFYGLARDDVVRVLRALLGIEHIAIEDRELVSAAVGAFEAGLDFADALHLARSAQTSAFVTFDRRFARRAANESLSPPVELLS